MCCGVSLVCFGIFMGIFGVNKYTLKILEKKIIKTQTSNQPCSEEPTGRFVGWGCRGGGKGWWWGRCRRWWGVLKCQEVWQGRGGGGEWGGDACGWGGQGIGHGWLGSTAQRHSCNLTKCCCWIIVVVVVVQICIFNK